jgi:hypothetical protein
MPRQEPGLLPGDGCPTDRVACADALVKIRLKPMLYRPALIDGFLAKTGLDLALPQPRQLKIFSHSLIR